MEELIPIEILGRYNWVAYYVDDEGNRYSREAKIPIKDNELCRWWKIYKVKRTGDYSFTILSERDDK